jgi:hypothetical protein
MRALVGHARLGDEGTFRSGTKYKVAVQRNGHFAFQRREDRDALLESG